MIPSANTILSTNLKVGRQPTKTYKINVENNVINGSCDKLEAMKQVVYKILNTERYEHIMYSWNYGIELDDLFGEPVNYVISELQRRITEALVQDDRIQNVDGFEYQTNRKAVSLTFTVHTIFGDIQSEKVVNL
jgi:phage baseplate assembly protein W